MTPEFSAPRASRANVSLQPVMPSYVAEFFKRAASSLSPSPLWFLLAGPFATRDQLKLVALSRQFEALFPSTGGKYYSEITIKRSQFLILSDMSTGTFWFSTEPAARTPEAVESPAAQWKQTGKPLKNKNQWRRMKLKHMRMLVHDAHPCSTAKSGQDCTES